MTEPTGMGRPTVLACPRCAGTLYELKAAGTLRFRCAQGHDHDADALCPGIAGELEGLLPELVDALPD